MSNQQRTQVYQKALADAQSELDEMLSEFNALASRKTQLEHVMTMLKPLLDVVQPGPATPVSETASMSAPARTFQPLSFSEPRVQTQAEPQGQFQVQLQDRVQDRIQDQSQFQELAPAPMQNFAEAAPVEAASAQEEQPAFAQVAQPVPEAVLQQQETPAPQTKPAASGDRLEDRINFALNFALLS